MQSAFKPQRLWATLIVLSLPLALTGCPDVLGPRIIAVRIASSDTPSSASLQTLTIETLRNGTVQESFDRASFSMIPSASAPHAFLLVAKTSIPADAISLSSTSLVTSLRTIDIRAMCVGQDTTGPVKE